MPHNLLLAEADHLRFGARAIMSPPLRGRAHADALWAALRDGTIDIIVTDHAPHLLEEKLRAGDSIWVVPAGIPGLETLLPLLVAEWRSGAVTLAEIVRWTATGAGCAFRPRARSFLIESADAL